MTVLKCRYGRLSVPDANDLICNALREHGEWAQAELDVLQRFIREGDTVYDVGAFIGTHSRAFSSMVGPEGRVIAFEPNPESYQYLLENARLAPHGNIDTYNIGLGKSPTTAFLNKTEAQSNLGGTRLSEESDSLGKIEISIETLDGIRHNRLDFIKVDVEGMEQAFLEGAKESIRQHQPVIFLEINSIEHASGHLPWAEEMGYLAYGHLNDAFNPENYNCSTKNLFGSAKECGLLLVPTGKANWYPFLNCSNDLQRVNSTDDLVKLLLEKPQYLREILEIKDFKEENRELTRKLNQSADRIATLTATIRSNEQEHERFTSSLEEHKKYIAYLEDQISHRDENFRQLTNSRSWRITRPLRVLARLIRGDFKSIFNPIQRHVGHTNARPTLRESGQSAGNPKVVVVVPVYRDVQMTVDCIESAIPGILELDSARLIAINDASPDKGMQDALTAVEKKWAGKVQVLKNDKNLGFVGTVNRGMKIDPDADIVLLNSDVVLPTGWLRRLRDDAHAYEDVATCTPLSNNTTICTFPEFLQDNPIPMNLEIQQIDDVFASVKLPCVPAPTGVGFCMYIKRRALDAVGLFDEEKFGRGYGEENDFCQRAAKIGLHNIISPNLYVYHRGGVSFGSEKTALVERATRLIDQLHPNYHADVQRFTQADPLKSARIYRYSKLLAARHIPNILAVSHGMGGGVDQHIAELSAHCAGSANILVLHPIDDTPSIKLCFGVSGHADSLVFKLPEQYDALVALLRSIGISLIHFHHILRVDTLVLELAGQLACPYVFTAHDFYVLCGNPTLTDENGIFPGAYDEELRNPLFPLPDGMTHSNWRDRYRAFVESAEAVIFPSESTSILFADFFKIKNRVIAYHPEEARDLDKPFLGLAKKEKYSIVVLGALGKEKGADLLEEMATIATQKSLPMTFTLIGYAYRPLKHVLTTGPYRAEDLKTLISNHQVDVILFPARCPETYSYTLSYAIDSGHAIAAPQLGAFPERLSRREGILLFDHRESAESTLSNLWKFVVRLSNGERICSEHAYQSNPRTDYYSREYLSLCAKSSEQAVANDEKTYSIIMATDHFQHTARLTRSEAILRMIWVIYSHPSTGWLGQAIPFSIKRKLKRLLSKRPIHELLR